MSDTEREEGEIVEDEDDITLDEDEDVTLDGDDEDDMEIDFGPDDVLGATEEMLASVLATPDGDTVCSALVHIGTQLEVQNKILIKILSKLT